MQYALSYYGLIPEAVYGIISVTTKKTRTFKSEFGVFTYKSIKNDLFTGYEMKKFNGKEYNFATPEKALFDLLYYLDIVDIEELEPNVLSNMRINYDALSDNNKKELRSLFIIF